MDAFYEESAIGSKSDKERRKYKTYKNKKFIKVEDMLFEVSKEEFDDYHREDERIRYRYNNFWPGVCQR